MGVTPGISLGGVELPKDLEESVLKWMKPGIAGDNASLIRPFLRLTDPPLSNRIQQVIGYGRSQGIQSPFDRPKDVVVGLRLELQRSQAGLHVGPKKRHPVPLVGIRAKAHP